MTQRREHRVVLEASGRETRRQQKNNTVPRRILALQSSAGNAVVARLLGEGSVGVQRVGTGPTLNLRQIRVTDFDGVAIQVKCTRSGPGQRWHVYLPPDGVPPEQLDAIGDTLGVAPADLDVTNSPATPGPHRDPAAQVRDATRLAGRYLAAAGITTVGDQRAADVLAQVRVQFFQDGAWAEVLASQTIGGGDANLTEAITTTQNPRGKREVMVNVNNHTLSALVHEMFHVLSANGIDGLWNGLAGELVEGITEYFTTRATGIGFRCTRGDGGRVYSDALGFVRHALATGLATEDQLRDGYFHGNLGPLAPMNKAFIAVQSASERKS